MPMYNHQVRGMGHPGFPGQGMPGQSHGQMPGGQMPGSGNQTPSHGPGVAGHVGPGQHGQNPANLQPGPNVQNPAQNPLKRRAGDKNLPDDISILVPESKSFKSLLDIEKKIDKQISWKRLEIQETLKRPLKSKRKLRVFITTHYQPGKRTTVPDAAGNVQNAQGTWELRVEGRLTDKKGAGNEQAEKDHNKKRKFSSFFQSLVIELDKDIYGPDQHLVEWHRERQNNETDGFQVKRPGDKDVRCTMLFMMYHEPQKCKLDISLARLLGLSMGTRAEVLYCLWNYIRLNKLQDPVEKDWLNLDPYLTRVFNSPRIKFNEIPQRITALLTKPDPIVIHQRIKCDPNEPKKTAMYDLDVDVDDITNNNMKHFLNSTNNNEKLNKLDNQIYDILASLKNAKLKHEFFDEFSLDPQRFIDKWLASQSMDLKTVKCEKSGKPSDDQRKAKYYNQDWVDGAVNRYFFNKLNENRLELEQAMYQKK